MTLFIYGHFDYIILLFCLFVCFLSLIALIFLSMLSPSPASIRFLYLRGNININFYCIVDVFLIKFVVVFVVRLK